MAAETKVALFDLNGTLYNESSKDEFFKFVCSKKPATVLKYIHMGCYIILQKWKLISQTEFKENFFSYLDGLPPAQVTAYAREFWQKEFPSNFNQELMSTVERLKREGVKVFIISGALELYMKPLMQMYKSIDGFAGTRVKYEDEKYLVTGEACKGEVKLQVLRELMNGKPYRIVEAYSDSKEPMLDAAEKAFLIKDGRVTVYK